jgi:membrane protein DedA with SNARE-associated domain
LVVAAALLVPAIPFLLLGADFETQILELVRRDWPAGELFAAVVGTLAVDILLPVPSSAVSTFAGASLGIAGGLAASWLGMTLGALGGYGLARWLGRPFAERVAGERELRDIEFLSGRYGQFVLVLTRAVPLLAEAAVVVTGAARLPLVRFLVPVALANFAISLVYVLFGHFAVQLSLLPLALAAAVLVPVVIVFLVRKRLVAAMKEP